MPILKFIGFCVFDIFDHKMSRPTCAPTIRSGATANGVYRSTVKQRWAIIQWRKSRGDRGGDTSPQKMSDGGR